MGIINSGFGAMREAVDPKRVPPGQFLVTDWPVLTYGPTPRTNVLDWTFRVEGLVDKPQKWSWEEFNKLPKTKITTDIHCVTRWSKLDTTWEGVSADYLLGEAGVQREAKFVVAFCDGGYTTNLPLADVLNGQAMVAYTFGDAPLEAQHGGPARFFVPHLYLWKSAKWVRGLRLVAKDEPGFWEQNGYNNHGDPWKEERYWER